MPENVPILDSFTAAYVDSLVSLGGPPIYTLPVEEARKALAALQDGPRVGPDADIKDSLLDTGQAGPVRVRIVRPRGATGALPVLLYLHGGGWVLGDCFMYERLARDLAAGANAAVVLVDYALSPEVRYPVALEQIYAVATYIASHGREFDLDGTRMAVGGDSAGGTLATGLALMSKARGGPRLCLQMLFYPAAAAEIDTPSRKLFHDGPWLLVPALDWFWGHYIPDRGRRSEALASPLLAGLEELSGLPDALVLTAEVDPLRDEGEAYAVRLMQAGVRVTAVRLCGTIHDFMMLDALRETPAARAGVALAVAALRRAFGIGA